MNLVDIVILLLVIASAVQGFRSGLIRCVFSLAGLIAGIAVASRYYNHFAYELEPLVHSHALADTIWFCLITLGVMLAAGVLGMLVKGLVHGIGLGWLDSILGLIFGLLRGAVLVTLCILILAAFYADTSWLSDAQLSRYFLGTTELVTQMTPEELRGKIRTGLHVLERDAPAWVHSK